MIYVVDIESIPTRYTSQWKNWIPKLIKDQYLQCTIIEGKGDSICVENDKFFDFFTTNRYKAQQINGLTHAFASGLIDNGDVILFTDAWHPGVIAARQMSLFYNKNVKIMGMWHAGSYDPHDLLGQKGSQYFYNFERSLYDCLDKSFFATQFHRDMFLENLNIEKVEKTFVTGFPYVLEELKHYRRPLEERENIIVFPHRLSNEKHPEMFDAMKKMFPDYELIKTLEVCPDKKSFYELLGRAKYSVSFADQETWGISMFESLYLGAIPIVPNKLSYQEMYSAEFKYYSSGTPTTTVGEVAYKIRAMEEVDKSDLQFWIEENIDRIQKEYCTFDNIISHLR